MQWADIKNFIKNAILEQRTTENSFVIDLALIGRKQKAFIQGSFSIDGVCLEISPNLLEGDFDKNLKIMSLHTLGWKSPDKKVPNYYKCLSNADSAPELIAQKFFEAFALGIKLSPEEVYF
jgi:hypothetical protein